MRLKHHKHSVQIYAYVSVYSTTKLYSEKKSDNQGAGYGYDHSNLITSFLAHRGIGDGMNDVGL